MKYVLTHYQGDWEWVKKYTEDVVVYNRSDQEISGSIPRENIGDADYDRLSYLIDNYETLPEAFLLSKSNLWKYIREEEFETLKDRREFTPLLTQGHKTYGDAEGPVCFYDLGLYWERNNSWYVHSVPTKYFQSFDSFAKAFGIPNPTYIPFAPGGNYILTRERVQRHPVELYKAMRDLLPWSVRPGEAQFVERSLYLLWS